MNKIYQKMYLNKKNPAKSKIGGFTLIELLVVVLIIGILAAVALPKYEVAVGRARVAKALPVLRALHEAKKRYYLANGEYTWDLDSLDISVPYNSKEFVGNGWFYYGTPIGDFKLPDTSAVYWEGPNLTIDVLESGWQCYPAAGYAGTVAEKICATLGPKKGIISGDGTPLYKIVF